MKTRTPSKQPDHVARAEAGLIVGRDLNSKGGVKVFLLGSNQILPRDSFTRVDLTDAVIAQINSLPDNLFSDDGATTHSPANAIARTAPPLPGVRASSSCQSSFTSLSEFNLLNPLPAPAAVEAVPVPEPSPTLSPTPPTLQLPSPPPMLSSSPPLSQSPVSPAPSTDRGDQR